jgi:hypothetical protein
MVKSFLAFAICRPALFDALDQFHRAGGCAYLAFVDHIGENIARRFFRLCGIDARQVVGLAAAGPELKPLGPGIERLRRIAGF